MDQPSAALAAGARRQPVAEQQDMLHMVVKGLPLAALVIAANGTVEFINFSVNAGSDWRVSLEEGVIGNSYPMLVDRMPLSPSARIKLKEQIRQVVDGSAINLEERFKLLATEPLKIVARATRLALREAATLVVFLATPDTRRRGDTERRQHMKILHAEQQERRRIARELHDDTFQQLAVIQMSTTGLRKARTFEEIDQGCEMIESALHAAQHQIRTLSFLLHPPVLGAGGIAEALRDFCKGLARRNGLIVAFEQSVEGLKSDQDLEITLYRVAQEALINACRHAAASEIIVRLKRLGNDLILEVQDNGVGIQLSAMDGNPMENIGVGLRGMQERVEALGGNFVVLSRHGTLVRAAFPRRRKGDWDDT